jgi:hypothetical protein
MDTGVGAARNGVPSILAADVGSDVLVLTNRMVRLVVTGAGKGVSGAEKY